MRFFVGEVFLGVCCMVYIFICVVLFCFVHMWYIYHNYLVTFCKQLPVSVYIAASKGHKSKCVHPAGEDTEATANLRSLFGSFRPPAVSSFAL